MRKLFLSGFICFSALFVAAQANWNNTSFVHRSGRQVLDGSNTPIRLEGVNTGGWLMWEGWIWGDGFSGEKQLRNRTAMKVGQAYADAFRDSVYKNYITRKDIEAISDECFNSIRVPFNHNLLEDDSNPFTYKQSGWNILDSLLSWCEDNNVYVLLDMHSAPGGQSPYFVTDPDSPNMWDDPIYLDRTVELWKAIANRYKSRGIIAGYDLLNEPKAPDDTTLVQFYERIIDSIRTVDQNHLFFLEGKDASQGFDIFTTLPDPNVLFSFHFYSWFTWNIPNALQQYVDYSIEYDVPVMCGEWGENNYDQLTTTLNFFKDPVNQISGETFWLWKKAVVGSSYPYLVGIDTTALWKKSIKWLSNGFNPNPTVAEMQQGMNEFIQNMKYENCFLNDTMSDLLKACSGTAFLEQPNTPSILLFPNPASNQVTFVASGKISQLYLYNSLGILIDTIPISYQQGTIDLQNYPEGMYFMTHDSLLHAGKLMIQK